MEQLGLSPAKSITIEEFLSVVLGNRKIFLKKEAVDEVERCSRFVSYLVDNNVKVYGVTTGFADLRDISIPKEKCEELSTNILKSHDAGIGEPLPYEVTLGAMLIRIISISKGKSGFSLDNLLLMIDHTNHRIVVDVPSTGSLGCSGDLPQCSRMGNGLRGEVIRCQVNRKYEHDYPTIDLVMEKFGINRAEFGAKEGLALTNGTPFSCSAAILGLHRIVVVMEKLVALQSLTLNALHVVEDAFCHPIHAARKQTGQLEIAKIFRSLILNSPYLDRNGVQNDYLFRCIPQIFGPFLEFLKHGHRTLESEMNAVTDNPLIFREKDITPDVPSHRIHKFEGEKWSVLSGGNFHGDCIAQVCDNVGRSLSKVVLTLERHITYMMNPGRHKLPFLPTYLVCSKKDVGLQSGFMIVQYTANSLAQKICYLGNPSSVFNITSANESEDIVSYSLTAAQKLMEQAKYFEQFSLLYSCCAMQCYAISRNDLTENNENFKFPQSSSFFQDLVCEKVFNFVNSKLAEEFKFPIKKDIPFEPLYNEMKRKVKDDGYRRIVGFPIASFLVKD